MTPMTDIDKLKDAIGELEAGCIRIESGAHDGTLVSVCTECESLEGEHFKWCPIEILRKHIGADR